jgi:acyl-CoA thioesterase
VSETRDSRFERDTAVTAEEPGRYRARIDPGWWILRGPNGGYVAALLLRAMSDAVGDAARRPRSLTVHFTSPPVEGETEVATCVERAGRSLSTVSARMTQEGALRALALAAFSRPRRGLELDQARMPEVPPPEELLPAPPLLAIHERYEIRYVEAPSDPQPTGEAFVCGWIRPAEPRHLDEALLAAYTDALPPALFRIGGGPEQVGPLPTVDLTVHFRADPERLGIGPEEFCLALFHSRLARDGFVEEGGEIWSRGGVLLAQSRQLAVVTGGAPERRD